MKIRALLIVAFRICGFATIGLLASQASAGDFYNDFSWLVDGKIVSTNTLLAAQTSITIAPGQTVSFSGTYYGEDLPPLYEATRSGTVFWGDGSQTNFSASLNSGAGGNVSTSLGTGSHVYQTPGIYQAGVTSECESHNGEPCGNILGIPVGYPLTVTVGSAQCNPPLTASLIDPVPDLVTTLNLALQGSVDVTSLSSKGRVVSGVSADGVTQAIVRVAASASGEVLQLTVSGDGSVGSVTRATVGSTVDVTATDTLLGPMAFAVYVAPKDFVRPGTDDDSHGSRNVTIQIKSLKTGCTLTLPVTIVRPPLALIHGVWSGPDTWNYFGVHMNNQLTLLKNDPRFNAFLINYKDTNGDGFLLNAYIVKGQIIQNLHSIKNGWNLLDIPIAAVQVDIVAHSMGGDLSRTMVTLPLYLTDTNYKQGWIHKLITIDTPHLGSEFANRLYNSKPLCKKVFGRLGNKVGGAIQDLQTNSDMIATTLRQPIFPLKAYTISGKADPGQAATAEANFQRFLGRACSGLLPTGGFAAVFGQDTNDLIVSGQSQAATGLGYDGTDPPTHSSPGLIHSVDPGLFRNGPDALSRNIQFVFTVGADTENPQDVIDLLNTPVGAGKFGELLP